MSLPAEILAAIEAEPSAYDPRRWGAGILLAPTGAAVERPTEDAPACLAGWAVALAGIRADDIRSPGLMILEDQIQSVAQGLLGLTDAEAAALFAPDQQDAPALLRAIIRERDRMDQ